MRLEESGWSIETKSKHGSVAMTTRGHLGDVSLARWWMNRLNETSRMEEGWKGELSIGLPGNGGISFVTFEENLPASLERDGKLLIPNKK